MAIQQEVQAYVEDWAKSVETVLIRKLDSYKIGHSGRLRASIMTEVFRQAEGTIGVKLYFERYGRFIDMGVGRGKSLSTREGFREQHDARKQRVPKPWYSRTYFAKVRQLNDVLAMKLTEEVVENIVKKNLPLTIQP